MTKRPQDRNGIDREVVIDELNHRLKNVLTIMQSFVSLAERDATDVEDFAADLRERIAAFATSHEQLSRTGFDAAPLAELMDIKLRPFALGDRLAVDGPHVNLAASAHTAVSMALHELTTNAVKYGAIGAPDGRLAVTWTWSDGGPLVLHWRESGGPEMTAPRRTGIGSRVLDKVIKHELKGEFDADYATDGLKVRIEIPGAFVSDGETTRSAAPDGDGIAAALPAEFSVLVVEDNAVIALDIADIVGRIGATRVETVGTIPDARRLLEELAPDFVLLDVNLGEETSIEFAGELARRNTRFAFMTGADGVSALPGELNARPVLQKPYSDASIRSVLGALAAAGA